MSTPVTLKNMEEAKKRAEQRKKREQPSLGVSQQQPAYGYAPVCLSTWFIYFFRGIKHLNTKLSSTSPQTMLAVVLIRVLKKMVPNESPGTTLGRHSWIHKRLLILLLTWRLMIIVFLPTISFVLVGLSIS